MDEGTKKAIEDSAQSVQDAINAMISSSFFAAIFLQATIEQLYGAIRAIQLIMTCSILNIKYPGIVQVYYASLVTIGGMDILGGEQISSDYLTLRREDPFSDTIERFGYDNTNYLMISGSIPLLIVIFLTYDFFAMFFHLYAIKNYKRSFWRKTGTSLDKRRRSYSNIMTLFIEGYIDIVMSCLMGISGFVRSEDFYTPSVLFENFDESLNTIFTVVSCVIVAIIPILTISLLFRNKNYLESDNFRSNYAVLFEELKPNLSAGFYKVFNLVRRALAVVILLFLDDYPGL